MSVITVCKNVIQANNKRGWKNPDPAIRVSRTPSGKAQVRAETVAILDGEGNTVARVVTTTDGKPIVKCGAKVAIFTVYEPEVLA